MVTLLTCTVRFVNGMKCTNVSAALSSGFLALWPLTELPVAPGRALGMPRIGQLRVIDLHDVEHASGVEVARRLLSAGTFGEQCFLLFAVLRPPIGNRVFRRLLQTRLLHLFAWGCTYRPNTRAWGHRTPAMGFFLLSRL